MFGYICYYRVLETKRGKLDKKDHKGIFMGYRSSKGYRIFCLKSDKLILSREVKFYDEAGWDWKNHRTSYSDSFSIEQPQLSDDELVDDVLVRGTRSLKDVYQWCNLVTSEPRSYAKAQDSQAWRRYMQEELDMIEKDVT